MKFTHNVFPGKTITIKYHCPNLYTPEDKDNKPQLELIQGQDFNVEHDCMPGPYDFLGEKFSFTHNLEFLHTNTHITF